MASLPILTYHRLLPEAPTIQADPKRISVSQKQFRQHMRWLYRLGYQTLRLGTYAEMLRAGKPFPARSVGISFDDGYREVLTLALPILQEFGFTATVFAVPGRAANLWDDGSASLLTEEEIRMLDRAGITIGAHSMTHPHLPQISPEKASEEILSSRQRLESLLGHPVTLFAYPYGENSPEVRALAAKAGYHAAFATDRAPLDHVSDFYQLRRAVVFPRNNAWEILLKSQRWYSRYQEWKRK